MSTPTKLGSFAAALALTFAASYAVGTAVGPVGYVGDDTPTHQGEPHSPVDHDTTTTTSPTTAEHDHAGDPGG